ncbi:MAG: flagellar biosynthesis protein FlhF [Nitrospirae bacterium]|nr:flagellar biosynthesis protein FlhF [Nitrospirota bacterium]
MQIKRFEAENVTSALKAVKAALGPDAVILETRKIGLGGRTGVQVTAAYEPPAGGARPKPLATLPAERPAGVVDPPWARAATRAERAPAPQRAAEGGGQAPAGTVTLAEVSAAIAPLRDELSTFGARLSTLGQPAAQGEWVSMREEIGTLRTLVNDLVVDRRVAELPDTLRPLYLRLAAKGLPRDSVAELLAALPGADPARVADAIASAVPVAGPLLPRDAKRGRVLFAGPTGVGKTTTIAKLAAHYAINEKRRVALITLDTFRIGAVEQLTTYAGIIGVPSAVASDRAELRARLAEFAAMDLVLIDTAGHSPRERGPIDAIGGLGDEAVQVQLVLPATHSLEDMAETLKAYRQVAPVAMVLTKLDETARLGAALHTALSAGVPVSYLTNGQRIPEDLQLASGARLATQFLS